MKYEFYEVNEERLPYYTEVKIKFKVKSDNEYVNNRTFILGLDKEATLDERTLALNCQLYELVYMETPEDKEAFGEYIDFEVEDEEVELLIFTDEFEEEVIDLLETLSED